MPVYKSIEELHEAFLKAFLFAFEQHKETRKELSWLGRNQKHNEKN